MKEEKVNGRCVSFVEGLFPFVCVDWDFVLHGRLAGWLVLLMVWGRCWLLFSSLM